MKILLEKSVSCTGVQSAKEELRKVRKCGCYRVEIVQQESKLLVVRFTLFERTLNLICNWFQKKRDGYLLSLVRKKHKKAEWFMGKLPTSAKKIHKVVNKKAESVQKKAAVPSTVPTAPSPKKVVAQETAAEESSSEDEEAGGAPVPTNLKSFQTPLRMPVKRFSAVLKANPEIRTIGFSLQPHDDCYLRVVAKRCTRLESLMAPSKVTVQALTAVLKANPNITKLDHRFVQKFSVEEGCALARSCKNLKEITFPVCSTADEVCAFVTNNPQLTHLNFGCCHSLKQAEYERIAKECEQSLGSLQMVCFSKNVPKEGILNMLEANPSLTCVKLLFVDAKTLATIDLAELKGSYPEVNFVVRKRRNVALGKSIS